MIFEFFAWEHLKVGILMSLRYLPNFYRVQIFIGNTVAYIDTKIRNFLNGMEDGGVPGFGQKSP